MNRGTAKVRHQLQYQFTAMGTATASSLRLFYRDARFKAYSCVSLSDTCAMTVHYCFSGPVVISLYILKTRNGAVSDVTHRPYTGVPGTRVPKCNLVHARRNVWSFLRQLSRNSQLINSVACRPLLLNFAKI
jgi:hypothetical protein